MWIRIVRGETGRIILELYNAKPLDHNSYVGDFGQTWRIKRIKRGWMISTLVLTFIDENEQIEYRTVNAVGDAIEKYAPR